MTILKENQGISKRLVVGDGLAILFVTLVGFATHGESGMPRLPRMLATFIPLALSWFLVAPFLGLYRLEITSTLRQQWRTFLAIGFAGPLAVLVRAILLNTVVIPIFGIVLSASTGLVLSAWRLLWLISTRGHRHGSNPIMGKW